MARHLIRSLAIMLLLTTCRQAADEGSTPSNGPQPTSTSENIQLTEAADQPEDDSDLVTITIDAPSRFKAFADIDPFGKLNGFDPELMAYLAANAGFEYEFVVTSFNGMLDSIAGGEFDLAMSALIRPAQPPPGLLYSQPYLEIGQVMLVRANENVLNGIQNIIAGVPLGAQRYTSGEQVARGIAGLNEQDLQLFESTSDAVQALIDRQIDVVILDSDDADYFATSYPQQLKIAGGPGRENWLSQKSYSLVVAEKNQALLESLNQAIANAHADGTIERLTSTWLVAKEPIAAGESLIGTFADELVIGLAGSFTDFDPAQAADLVGWELMLNTMSGLLMYDAGNNLAPILAADFPTISENKLEYTISLRPGLVFPDGSELTVEDVQYSILRSARLGNFQVNAYLKDENEDNFADPDAIQIIDPLTIKIILQEPTSFFPSLLATPPYFIVNQDCYTTSAEPASECGAIGAYSVSEWAIGEEMRLKAYPQWPGPEPAFENILVRFYESSEQMRRSLENNAIDVAWTGLSDQDLIQLRQSADFTYWEGASVFKSYLVFNHAESPWDSKLARQAVGLAIDRQALADNVFQGNRKPLLSPVPEGSPGYLPAESTRDLERARTLLTQAGYGPSRKLEMTLWFVDDGRYTNLEDEYAAALKAQLEETELIEVTLQGAPWEIFRPQSLSCNYPAFLLGWPSSGQPAAYLDAMSWLEYFITNTDSICSNYESPAMDTLLEAALEETGSDRRLEIYGQIQTLWADELPTLDLTQTPRATITTRSVSGIAVDAMGLLHYEVLSKTGS